EGILGRLRIAQDRGQGLVQFMREGDGELADRRDPADVGEILPEVMRLDLRPPACQDIREDLAEELEPLHQLIRPCALGSSRAERQRSYEDPPIFSGISTCDLTPSRR